MEQVETSLFVVPSSSQEVKEGEFFKIVYGNQSVINTIDVDQSLVEKGLQVIEYAVKSEKYLIEAARNFIRKINFSELNESLEDGEIDEEWFNQELDKNGDKYTITLRDINNPSDAILIAQLIKKIGYELRDFSTSKVSEMFSVKENQLISLIDSLRHQIK